MFFDSMDKRKIIKEVENCVKKELAGDSTGHDWWHIRRVRQMAKVVAEKEGGDLFVIELAALLHDIADWKFNDGDEKAGSKKTKDLLEGLGINEEIIKQVGEIVDNVSFKGAGVENKIKTKEGMIVQDADRLDVIGAIGAARIFAYGGSVGREIYDPNIKPKFHKTFEDYKKNKSSSINHFYEKVLLLKDRLNTKTARKIAVQRHKFLEKYLEQFFKEWEGAA
jgi:uncharacterized protein